MLSIKEKAELMLQLAEEIFEEEARKSRRKTNEAITWTIADIKWQLVNKILPAIEK